MHAARLGPLASLGGPRRLVALAGACLQSAHRPALARGGASEAPAGSVVLGEQQRPTVALAERTLLQQCQGVVWKVQQPQQVGDRHPPAPHAAADVLASQPELLYQRSDRTGLLDW